MIMILAVTQIITFSAFPEILSHYWLVGGGVTAAVIAGLLVVFEVLSVPFLLGLRMSPAMRVVSMVSGWLLVIIWLFLLVPANFGMTAIENAGMLGATLAEPISWWLVVRIVALGVLIAWAAWGMWPFAPRKSTAATS